MRKNFFDHINIDLATMHVPDGSNPDAEAACAEYDAMVKAVGYVDLQLHTNCTVIADEAALSLCPR